MIALLFAQAVSVMAGADARCPSDMARVQGEHAETLHRICTDWRDGHCFAILPHVFAEEGVITPVDVCIDRFEWPNKLGVAPRVMASHTDATAACGSQGKRLCTEFEWELGCEGNERRPWPYGWAFAPEMCNSAAPYRQPNEGLLASRNANAREREVARLWQGKPAGTFPQCISLHGAIDMTGNAEEWVNTSRPEWPYTSSLKGGYWSKPWAGCRGTNDSHDRSFRFYETGFRCCQDPSPK